MLLEVLKVPSVWIGNKTKKWHADVFIKADAILHHHLQIDWCNLSETLPAVWQMHCCLPVFSLPVCTNWDWDRKDGTLQVAKTPLTRNSTTEKPTSLGSTLGFCSSARPTITTMNLALITSNSWIYRKRNAQRCFEWWWDNPHNNSWIKQYNNADMRSGWW